ncbi:MAG: hypothetical protein ACREFY_10100 [Acetobacteraceae bacterium]
MITSALLVGVAAATMQTCRFIDADAAAAPPTPLPAGTNQEISA